MSTMGGDIIEHPFAVVDALYHQSLLQRSNTQPSPLSCDVVSDFGEKIFFDNLLQHPQLSASIPLLSSEGRKHCIGQIKQNSLVRYRGLVQDIYDSEYYCASYEETNLHTKEKRMVLSKYRDAVALSSIKSKDDGIVDFDLDGPQSKTLERLPILCIPVPGESGWAGAYFGDNSNNTFDDSSIEKSGDNGRKRNESDTENTINISWNSTKLSCNGNNKAAKVDAECNRASTSERNGVRFADSMVGEAGLSNCGAANSSIFDPITTMNQNDRVLCLAKIYATDSSSIRLNDMLEIVGIYSTDDGTIAFADNPSLPFQIMDTVEDHMLPAPPPASSAPRIHCLTFRRLGSLFPLLVELSPHSGTSDDGNHGVSVIPRTGGLYSHRGCNATTDDSSTIIASLLGQSVAIREHIIDKISCILRDRLVSEYVLLSLLSKVFARSSDTVLGFLPLNITGFAVGDSRISALHEYLSSIVPRISLLGVSLPHLNETPYMPARNYSINRIPLSPLQVGAGTVLIFDDTAMTEGQLSVEGFKSMTAIRSVVSTQKLPVDFTYCKVDVPTDVAILFLSHTSPSILSPNEVLRICLTPSSSSSSGGGNGEGEWEEQARLWLQVARSLSFTVDESLVSRMEDDFVRARQLDRPVPVSIFHTWVTLARLVAFSFGSSCMQPQHWEHAMRLEKQRMAQQHGELLDSKEAF